MSELRANTISDAAGTGPVTLTGQRAAKIIHAYNGVTATTLDSFNVSSLTDNGAGNQVTNFSVAMASSDYKAEAGRNIAAGGIFMAGPNTMTASVAQVLTTFGTSGTLADASYVSLSIHGDLA